MVEIALTNSVRTNLLALKRNAQDTGVVQNRLATGLKVQDAVDDPIKFFTAKGLSDKAGDFEGVKNQTQQGISVLKTSLTAIKAVTSLVEQMKGLVNAAQATANSAERTRLTTQINDLYTQINEQVADADYNGTNLLKASPDDLKVFFNEDNTSSLTVKGIATDTTGLGFPASLDLTSDSAIETARTEVDDALAALRTTGTSLGSNQAVLTSRLEFTEEYVNRLLEGAGLLTHADTNEEGANLLALQTRQQLALNSLSLATQSERSVLNLF